MHHRAAKGHRVTRDNEQWYFDVTLQRSLAVSFLLLFCCREWNQQCYAITVGTVTICSQGGRSVGFYFKGDKLIYKFRWPMSSRSAYGVIFHLFCDKEKENNKDEKEKGTLEREALPKTL